MAIQSGLLYSAKGAKADVGGVGITLNANYLQLPVHFAYKLMLLQALRLYCMQDLTLLMV